MYGAALLFFLLLGVCNGLHWETGGTATTDMYTEKVERGLIQDGVDAVRDLKVVLFANSEQAARADKKWFIIYEFTFPSSGNQVFFYTAPRGIDIDKYLHVGPLVGSLDEAKSLAERHSECRVNTKSVMPTAFPANLLGEGQLELLEGVLEEKNCVLFMAFEVDSLLYQLYQVRYCYFFIVAEKTGNSFITTYCSGTTNDFSCLIGELYDYLDTRNWQNLTFYTKKRDMVTGLKTMTDELGKLVLNQLYDYTPMSIWTQSSGYDKMVVYRSSQQPLKPYFYAFLLVVKRTIQIHTIGEHCDTEAAARASAEKFRWSLSVNKTFPQFPQTLEDDI